MRGVRRTSSAVVRSCALARLAAFPADRRGNIAAICAVLMMPVAMLAGGASDLYRAHNARAALQAKLDAGVLAGAMADADDAVALAAFNANPLGGDAIASAPEFRRAAQTYSGVATAQVPTAFLALGSIQAFTIQVRASASLRQAPSDVCLTLLDQQSSLDINSATIDAPGCRFDIRSTSSTGLKANSSTVTVKEVCLAGSGARGASLPSTLKKNCIMDRPLEGDPLLPSAAELAGCDHTDFGKGWTGARSMTPGAYCGHTQLDSAQYAMAPGLYVFHGPLTANAGSITGNGVRLHFTSNAKIEFNSETVKLSAPASGKHRGILFSEAPGLLTATSPDPVGFSLNSTGSSALNGLIHLPSRNAELNSGSARSNDKTTMVLRSLSVNSQSWSFAPAPLYAGAKGGQPVLKS